VDQNNKNKVNKDRKEEEARQVVAVVLILNIYMNKCSCGKVDMTGDFDMDSNIWRSGPQTLTGSWILVIDWTSRWRFHQGKIKPEERSVLHVCCICPILCGVRDLTAWGRGRDLSKVKNTVAI
jgi:hypothetical protein